MLYPAPTFYWLDFILFFLTKTDLRANRHCHINSI